MYHTDVLRSCVLPVPSIGGAHGPTWVRAAPSQTYDAAVNIDGCVFVADVVLKLDLGQPQQSDVLPS